MEVVVRDEGEHVVVKTPYLPDFITDLKKHILPSERKFDPKEKAWKVSASYRDVVEKLVSKHFSELRDVLILAIGEGEPPSVGGLGLLDYGRDYSSPRRSDLVNVVTYKRVGDHGSRKYPTWNGYVLARAKINQNTRISARYYRVFEFEVNTLDILQNLLEELAENYGDDFDTAIKEIESLDLDSVVFEKRLFENNPVEQLSETISEIEEVIGQGMKNEAVRKLLLRLKKSLELEIKRIDDLLNLFE